MRAGTPTQLPNFKIEPLSRHDRAAFSCGIAALDDYLKKHAGQDSEKRVSVTFILTPEGRTVAGFYTLSQYAVDLVKLPDAIAKKLPRYPEIPATLLGRLAISEEFKGMKLGEYLLMDALYRALHQSKHVASAALIVDAKDSSAKSFYLRYGFIPFIGIPNRMFLPMKTIAKMFQK